MEITWYGLSCFRMRSRKLTVVADPYDAAMGPTLPRLRANVITSSHDAPGHNHIWYNGRA